MIDIVSTMDRRSDSFAMAKCLPHTAGMIQLLLRTTKNLLRDVPLVIGIAIYQHLNTYPACSRRPPPADRKRYLESTV